MQYESITAISLKANCFDSRLFNLLADFFGMNLHSAPKLEILKNVRIKSIAKFFMQKSYPLCCAATISIEKITYIPCFFLFLLCFKPDISCAYDYEQFKTSLLSPLEHEESQKTLITGSLITAVLVTQRENFVDPLSQKYGAEEKPMGDLAVFGDYMGQWVPNLSYMAYQYFSESQQAQRRINYMFQTTAYTGVTTVILKLLFNQRRPHKGDRRSFPSGHTSTAFAFAGVIHYEYQDPLYSTLAFTMASIVGLSRINDHAHYLHDVVFGATLGIAYAQALKDKFSHNISIIPFIGQDKGGVMASLKF